MNIPVLIDLSTADVTKPIENMTDRLSAAGQTLVLGVLAVFSVLAILWLVLEISGRFFKQSKNKTDIPTEPKPAPAVQPTAQQINVQTATPQNDAEIVAAITAAISVMLDKPQTEFRVVSFRQASREAFRRNNTNRN